MIASLEGQRPPGRPLSRWLRGRRWSGWVNRPCS